MRFFFILLCIFCITGGVIAMPNAENSLKDSLYKADASLYGFEADIFQLEKGKLTIVFIGHASLLFNYNGIIIHVDPASSEADYSVFPKADIILVTHSHSDHLDTGAIGKIRKDSTMIFTNADSAKKIKDCTVMAAGDEKTIHGISITAVPAYNITPGRNQFHPKGRDIGFILASQGKRLYIAGDTENTPELMALRNIDIAFLPMNQPYTMLPSQAADAARAIKPAFLYPYHFSAAKTDDLVQLLKTEKTISVRIRKLN